MIESEQTVVVTKWFPYPQGMEFRQNSLEFDVRDMGFLETMSYKLSRKTDLRFSHPTFEKYQILRWWLQ